MTATEHTIASLRAAIDAGDYSVLPILADALEDNGDTRAVGLRECIRREKRPDLFGAPGGMLLHGWQLGYGHAWTIGYTTLIGDIHYGDWYLYPTCSAAYLALAEALTLEISYDGISR